LVESRKRVVAIVVGIAGVGKSTVISRAAELLSQKNTKATIIVFGTLMFEESKKMGLKNRDEMRKLSIEDQHLLQDIAAKRIAQMNEEILIIDTHMFINTTEGYYPGIPSRLLEILKPSYLIMIAADPAEIVRRRTTDNTRDRDIVSLENIRNELEISKAMVATSSVLTGSPFILIANDNGMIDNAASTIVNVLAKGS
jgi:adenylate kinase